MTPKEKSIELVNKFLRYVPAEEEYEFPYAKQCALIAVDTTINTLNHDIRDLDVRGSVLLDLIKYWREVKQEIENL